MNKQAFVDALTVQLKNNGVEHAERDAKEYVDSNPGMEEEMTVDEAVKEWLIGWDDALSFNAHHPARYSTS